MASTTLDLPAMNGALREYYDAQKVQTLAYAQQKALALVPKDEDSEGKYIPIPVVYEVSQGRSSVFGTAQNNQTAAAIAEFLLTRKADYSIASVDNQTLEASNSSVGAFLKASTGLIDWAIRSATISAGSSLFRTGTGTIGQVASITNGVITLTNPADACQFGVNMTLQANTTDGGSPRAQQAYIVSRSIRNGTISVSMTLGGAIATPTGWQANDFLLVMGDNNNKFSGWAAWLPMTDPGSADNFYGVNRSVDSRLFGVSFDGSGVPVEEAIIDHSILLGREGATPDHFITNFGSYSSLAKAMGTRRQYVDVQGEGGIGFRGIIIEGATGDIRCFTDRNCQVKTGFMLTMDTWKLYSLGPVPKILRYEDRVEMLRVYNADAAECRIASYCNLGCDAPGWSGQLALQS